MGKRLDLLERALAAEEARDEAARKLAVLEGRLRAALNADPTTASRALSWIGRAEAAETLVKQVLRYVDQRSLASSALPPGWVARAEAQMRALKILQRDMPDLDKPSQDPDEIWATYVERESGRRSLLVDP